MTKLGGLVAVGAALFAFLPACTLPTAATSTIQPAPERPSASEGTRVEECWPDGTLRVRKQVVTMPDGTVVDHGLYTRWHTNGQKEYEVTLNYGKKDGVQHRWHANGQLRSVQHYVNGQRHGSTTTWDEKGRKRTEEFHNQGQPDGTWTVWDDRGRVKWQGRFDKGAVVP